MKTRLRKDALKVTVHALHKDTCTLGIGGFHDQLGCASGFRENDYVLSAQFAYLQEAIDYAHEGAKRGVTLRLESRIVREPFIRYYKYIPEQGVKSYGTHEAAVADTAHKSASQSA